ncbi:hypothetical protein [Candidatus Binatus sp.]|jgi:hypothetical protein|uniref:hypothetical protein n=1 Tax=Candidatus Binatus sp. TaxID=2811406 RepID=UPI003BD3A5BE
MSEQPVATSSARIGLDRIVMDIRSRHGHGYYIMARGMDYPVVNVGMLSEATAALVKLIDPTVEIVNYMHGKRFA